MMSYDGITSGRDSEFFDPEKFSIGNPTKLIWKSDVQCGAISYISFWDGYYWLYHIEWLWSLVFMFDLGSCGVPFLLTEGGWVEPAEDSSRITLNMGVDLTGMSKTAKFPVLFRFRLEEMWVFQLRLQCFFLGQSMDMFDMVGVAKDGHDAA